MHNLHFIMVKADSAEEAASTAENGIMGWGAEDNWRSIGGIASEDGSDDTPCHDDGYPLSFLDTENVPKEGTYFSRTVAYLFSMFNDQITLHYMPQSNYPDIRSAINAIGDELLKFNPDTGYGNTLSDIAGNLKHLHQIMDSRFALKSGKQIPEFYSWQLDEEGLTDLSNPSDSRKRYIIFLNMHS